MSRSGLLGFMALLEGGAGLLLILQPGSARRLLLGQAPLLSDAGLRLTGLCLLGLGLMCLVGYLRHGGRQLFPFMLAYNMLGAAGLAAIALFAGTAGPLLWPAVVLHAALAGMQLLVGRSA